MTDSKSGGECKTEEAQDPVTKDTILKEVEVNSNTLQHPLYNQEIVNGIEENSKRLPFKETEIVIPTDGEPNVCHEKKGKLII